MNLRFLVVAVLLGLAYSAPARQESEQHDVNKRGVVQQMTDLMMAPWKVGAAGMKATADLAQAITNGSSFAPVGALAGAAADMTKEMVDRTDRVASTAASLTDGVTGVVTSRGGNLMNVGTGTMVNSMTWPAKLMDAFITTGIQLTRNMTEAMDQAAASAKEAAESTLQAGRSTLNATKAMIEAGKEVAAAIGKSFVAAESAVEAGESALDTGEAALQAGSKLYGAGKQITFQMIESMENGPIPKILHELVSASNSVSGLVSDTMGLTGQSAAQPAVVATAQTSPQAQVAQSAQVAPTRPQVQVAPTSPQVQVAPTSPQVQVAQPSPQVQVAQTSPQVQVAPTSPQVQVAPTSPQLQVAPTSPQVQVAPTSPPVQVVQSTQGGQTVYYVAQPTQPGQQVYYVAQQAPPASTG